MPSVQQVLSYVVVLSASMSWACGHLWRFCSKCFQLAGIILSFMRLRHVFLAGPVHKSATPTRQAALQFKQDDRPETSGAALEAAATAVSPTLQPENAQYSWREQW